ncbi:MAG: hypothetical protein WBW33_24140 [Bryobacteraceae bacterium]
MFGAIVMTGLCAVGIAFNARFLVALLREPKVPRVVYRLRMKLDSGEAVLQPSSGPPYQATQVSSLAERF